MPDCFGQPRCVLPDFDYSVTYASLCRLLQRCALQLEPH